MHCCVIIHIIAASLISFASWRLVAWHPRSIRMIRCLVFSNLYPFFLRSPCQIFSVFGVYFFWYSFWEWGYQKLLSLSHIKYSKLIIRSLLCICDKTIKYYYIKSFFTDTKYMFFIILRLFKCILFFFYFRVQIYCILILYYSLKYLFLLLYFCTTFSSGMS